MVLLMLYTLLLMAASLSAVPHGKEHAVGEDIASKPAWTHSLKAGLCMLIIHAYKLKLRTCR